MPAVSVPLAKAKNHLSALVARVERGEEVSISRRGVPVVRPVPDLLLPLQLLHQLHKIEGAARL